MKYMCTGWTVDRRRTLKYKIIRSMRADIIILQTQIYLSIKWTLLSGPHPASYHGFKGCRGVNEMGLRLGLGV